MMIISSRGVKPSGNLTSDISLALLLVICPLPNFSTALQSQMHNSDRLLVVFLFPAFAQMLFTNYFNGLELNKSDCDFAYLSICLAHNLILFSYSSEVS